MVKKLKEKRPKVKGILIQLGIGGITLPTVTQAMKNEITIIAREGIKLIAKKLGHPMP